MKQALTFGACSCLQVVTSFVATYLVNSDLRDVIVCMPYWVSSMSCKENIRQRLIDNWRSNITLVSPAQVHTPTQISWSFTNTTSRQTFSQLIIHEEMCEVLNSYLKPKGAHTHNLPFNQYVCVFWIVKQGCYCIFERYIQ